MRRREACEGYERGDEEEEEKIGVRQRAKSSVRACVRESERNGNDGMDEIRRAIGLD